MELQAQAGGGGCQEDDRIDGGAAGEQIELQAQAGGGGGQGEDRIYGGVAGGQVELVLLEDRWSWCCWRTGGAAGPGWCWRLAGRGHNSC